MLGRLIAVIAGIGAAIAASQGPGFTLQYMQNLTGRVDELRPIVEQFDADVGRYGYTRDAAMSECETADGLLDALCSSYETVVLRFEVLSTHLNELNAASDYVRPLVLARSYQQPMVREITESVYSAFEPAIPATPVGFAYGGGGFVVGWGLLSFLFGLLGSMTGGRRYA